MVRAEVLYCEMIFGWYEYPEGCLHGGWFESKDPEGPVPIELRILQGTSKEQVLDFLAFVTKNIAGRRTWNRTGKAARKAVATSAACNPTPTI